MGNIEEINLNEQNLASPAVENPDVEDLYTVELDLEPETPELPVNEETLEYSTGGDLGGEDDIEISFEDPSEELTEELGAKQPPSGGLTSDADMEIEFEEDSDISFGGDLEKAIELEPGLVLEFEAPPENPTEQLNSANEDDSTTELSAELELEPDSETGMDDALEHLMEADSELEFEADLEIQDSSEATDSAPSPITRTATNSEVETEVETTDDIELHFEDDSDNDADIQRQDSAREVRAQEESVQIDADEEIYLEDELIMDDMDESSIVDDTEVDSSLIDDNFDDIGALEDIPFEDEIAEEILGQDAITEDSINKTEVLVEDQSAAISDKSDETIESFESSAQEEDFETLQASEPVFIPQAEAPPSDNSNTDQVAASGSGGFRLIQSIAELAEDPDFDAEILEIFIDEADELLEDIDGSISGWETEPSDSEPIEELKRSLHTFKGGARLAGLMVIGDVAHDFETALINAQTNNNTFDPGLIEEAHRYEDSLIRLVDQVKNQLAGQMPEGLQQALDEQAAYDARTSKDNELSESSFDKEADSAMDTAGHETDKYQSDLEPSHPLNSNIETEADKKTPSTGDAAEDETGYGFDRAADANEQLISEGNQRQTNVIPFRPQTAANTGDKPRHWRW